MQKINLSHLINPSDTGSKSGNGSFRLQGNAQITNGMPFDHSGYLDIFPPKLHVDSEQYMAMQQPPLIQSTITLPQNTTNTKTSNNSKPLISQQIPMYKQDKPVASEPVSSNDGKVMNTYGTANSAQNSDPMRLSLDASDTDVIQIQLYRQGLNHLKTRTNISLKVILFSGIFNLMSASSFQNNSIHSSSSFPTTSVTSVPTTTSQLNAVSHTATQLSQPVILPSGQTATPPGNAISCDSPKNTTLPKKNQPHVIEQKLPTFTWAPIDLTDPAKQTAFVPLNPQPSPECQHGRDVGVPFTQLGSFEWDGWVNGVLAFDCTHADNCGGSYNSPTISGGWETRQFQSSLPHTLSAHVMLHSNSNREFGIVQNEQEISAQILNTLKSEPRNRKSPTWTSDSDTEIIHTAGKDDTNTGVKLLNDIDMPSLMERFKYLCGLQHDSLSAEKLWHDRDIKLEKDDIQDVRAGQLTSWIIDVYFEAYDHVRIQGIYILKCFDHSDFEEIFNFNMKDRRKIGHQMIDDYGIWENHSLTLLMIPIFFEHHWIVAIVDFEFTKIRVYGTSPDDHIHTSTPWKKSPYSKIFKVIIP
ncbi:hypothetical protein K435DRAFT_865127 [Dendrothele bispora CBS 962.96]|uniref:Uncharacterized protein n=1 Tax=Dendrothele bispora (strain CBS 962.96) TaxID=1314807 RepID=A0A4S8LK72_DENBC|nr:hypothetical protein K435DRAFT_865127 [Dendrothele bispora CBS 962.96]